jgi:hypothetical protein
MPIARTAVAALLLLAFPALADTVHWINPAGGSFEDNANWDRGTPPALMDVAVFDLDATYTVTLTADHATSLHFTRGDVTMNLGTHTLATGQGLPPYYGFIDVVPAGATCAARFQGGTVPLWNGPSVGAGALLSVSGTGMSDVIGSNHATGTFSAGSHVIVTNSGLIVDTDTHISGDLLISGGGLVSAETVLSNPPATITVTGTNSRIRAEDSLTLGGVLHIQDGGTALVLYHPSMTLTNCQATVEGAGASFDSQVITDAATSILARDGGLIHSIGQSTFNGPVILGPGGGFSGSAIINGPFTIDIDATLNVGYMYFNQPITVVLDGLSARTTPILNATSTSFPAFQFTGPLTVQFRNPNAVRVGRIFDIVHHGLGDYGSFSSLVAPQIDGGRTFTMTQTGNIGEVTVNVVPGGDPCWSADFDGDGDTGTDADIEAFFACIAGNCCAACGSTDFNSDGDASTDLDIESFFRLLAGGNC